MGAGASAMAPVYAPPLGETYDPDLLNNLIQAGITRMNRLTEELAFTNSSIRLLSNQLGVQLVRSEYAELQARFTEWESASEREKKTKLRQIQARFVRPKVLWCSDMSGFSRICKEEGILHFVDDMQLLGGDLTNMHVEMDRRLLDYVCGLDTEFSELVNGSHLFLPEVALDDVVLPADIKSMVIDTARNFEAVRHARAELGGGDSSFSSSSSSFCSISFISMVLCIVIL